MNVKKDLTWEFQNTKLMEIKRLNCNFYETRLIKYVYCRGSYAKLFLAEKAQIFKLYCLKVWAFVVALEGDSEQP